MSSNSGFQSGRMLKNSATDGAVLSNPNMKRAVSSISSSSGAPKKLVIKPFKVQPKVPENFALNSWTKLKSAVDAVYSKNATNISKEEIYRAVEDLCMQKMGAKTYDLIAAELDVKISQKVDGLIDQTADLSAFAALVDGIWSDHAEQLNTIRNIFLYLDRSYALPNSAVKLIWDLGNDQFRKQLDKYARVQEKIVTALLLAIENYRNGEMSDSAVIARLSQMLSSLGLYAQFEHALLLDSARFFAAEGNASIENFDTAHFLALVDKRLQEVVEMTHNRIIGPGTRKPLLDIIENQLLRPHLNQLIERGFKTLMDGDRIDDLRRMYQLYSRVASLPLLQQAWGAYSKHKGELLVQDPEAQKRFVEDILCLHSKLEMVLRRAFFQQESFKSALKSSFEYFVNINMTSAASLIARFVDRKLRGEKGVSEAEVEAKMDQVMMLFRYIQEKDVFEAFYKKHLAKRLLLGKSASYELEKLMLGKLKTECGSNYTSKLEGMFQDVELSRECQAAFLQHIATTESSNSSSESIGGSSSSSSSSGSGDVAATASTVGTGTEMSVQVLTTGYWPAAVATDGLLLPLEITALMEKFNSFYVSKYQGRRLRWAHALERCIVTARFPRGKKDLEVSLFQALVLGCFNRADKLTYADIRSQTCMEAGELKRTLQSLACGALGTRVLLKEPRGRDVNDATDVFFFNADFSNKLFRIKINTIQLKETTEEIAKTNEEVFRDREYQVDAVIVRTMKARQRLPHTALISELMSQLRFPAQTSDLKKRIESLIERDYLERDANDNTIYNYLA